MKIIESIKNRIKGFLSAPLEEMGSWAKFVRYQIQVWRFCFKRLRENNAMAMSAALSFRTIFAMIPVLVLAFLMFRAMGKMDQANEGLHDLLDKVNLTKIKYIHAEQTSQTQPAESLEISVAQKIEDVVSAVESKLTAGRLGPVGVVLLVWTALTLLTTIERSLNRIFGASQDRKFAHRIVTYWSVLTLGPLLLMVTFYIAGKASHAVENYQTLSWLVNFTGKAGAFIVAVLVAGWFYKLIPNTFVRFDAAVGGAFVAVILWLAAKWGFGLYVEYVVGKQSLYGALGLLPLFLMWMNLCWWIFLFGAQLAHSAASVFNMDVIFDETKPGPWTRLAGLISICQRQITNDGPVSVSEVAADLGMPVSKTYEILVSLIETNDVCRVTVADEALFLLARPADHITTAKILQSSLEDGRNLFSAKMSPKIRAAIESVQAKIETGVGQITVASLVE